MGDWLKRKAIGLVLGILGLAAWLGYHSLVGGNGDSSKELKEIPKSEHGMKQMQAAAHCMRQTYGNFNAPVHIAPPR